MERVAQFRVGELGHVFEVHALLEPTPDVGAGSGGTIEPGELNIVGDRIRVVFDTVTPDVRVAFESSMPIDTVHIDAEEFLSAFRADADPIGRPPVLIDPTEWGIRPVES